MGNPEPNPGFRKQTKIRENKKKKDRCRDSMEAVLTNGVDCVGNLSIETSERMKMKEKTIYIARLLKYYIK